MSRGAAKRWVVVAVTMLAIGWGPVPACAESTGHGGAFTKLSRGFMNIITGWVEIPKRIYEVSEESGAMSGFTWGLLLGIGRGFIRTAAGCYELVTFPYPAPPNYQSVIQPEYVFVVETKRE